MKSIEPKDMIEGRFYTNEYSGQTYVNKFRKFNEKGILAFNISITGSEHTSLSDNSGWSYLSSLQNLRESTPDEQYWLEMCIKEGKRVPKPEYKEDMYEIY